MATKKELQAEIAALRAEVAALRAEVFSRRDWPYVIVQPQPYYPSTQPVITCGTTGGDVRYISPRVATS